MAWSQDLEEGSPAFEIAACDNPSVRVVAGPGAGKSFAMKRRVARLLENGVDPKSILPVMSIALGMMKYHGAVN